jgi:hypothetical protein
MAGHLGSRIRGEWNFEAAAPDPAISRSCSFAAAYQSNMAAIRRLLNPVRAPDRDPAPVVEAVPADLRAPPCRVLD